MKLFRKLVLVFCLALVSSGMVPVHAATEVRVATRVLPPMVMSQDGALSGFSIELWNEIARRTNIIFKYEVYPDCLLYTSPSPRDS